MQSHSTVYYQQKIGYNLVNSPPKRIISLVPSLTELLVDIGLEHELIGITKFCVHPSHLKKSKKVVGGTKQIQLEAIKQLQPDIVIANKEENTQAMVMALSNICPVYVTEIYTLQDNLSIIEEFGQVFEKTDYAKALTTQINRRFELFQAIPKKTITVAYFIWTNPYMVAGKNTFIDDMLCLCGFKNAYELPNSRYPEIHLDSLKELHVQLILLSSEPYPFKEKHITAFKQQLPNAQVMLVDGELFSWYGSRILNAFDYYENLLNQLKIT